MERRSVNTTISYVFRVAVAAHFAFLYLLIFGLPYTLAGLQHFAVAVVLTVLMAMIAVLIVADMATRTDARRPHAKLIDGVIASTWLVVVGFLLLNDLRYGW